MSRSTPDQIAQDVIDRKSEWFDVGHSEWFDVGHFDGAGHVDECALRLIIVSIVEKERDRGSDAAAA